VADNIEKAYVSHLKQKRGDKAEKRTRSTSRDSVQGPGRAGHVREIPRVGESQEQVDQNLQTERRSSTLWVHDASLHGDLCVGEWKTTVLAKRRWTVLGKIGRKKKRLPSEKAAEKPNEPQLEPIKGERRQGPSRWAWTNRSDERKDLVPREAVKRMEN
jgi:hypothetical protein